MKVLKKGKPWSIKRTCTGAGNGDGGCGAKLEVEAQDLYSTESHSYDGSSESYVTFRCVLCKTETDVDEDRIPSQVCDNLPEKSAWRRRSGRTAASD